MEKLDDESAAKFINALIKSVQTLCHGYLDFHNGIEIIGHINLSVDKGSSLHYILEEKVCKNEENSTLFISNSFYARNQKSDSKGKGKDTQVAQAGNQVVQRTNSTDTGDVGKVSSAISSISSALSRSHEKSHSGSTSSAKDTNASHSAPVSSTAKRKASDDLSNDVVAAKSSHKSSSPSPVSHFLSQSPHDPSGSSSPVDTKPTLSELRGEDSLGTVLPQTAGVGGESASDLGVNLAGSVLERVDDHSNSDLPERGDDSDGDLEVTFIKEEYVEGEQSACQFENSGGQQYGRGTHQRASSSDNMPDASLYPVSLHHSASATFVPSAHDMTAAQHYGPSTSSQPQPGTSGVRGDFKDLQGHHARWSASEFFGLHDRKKQDENVERQNKWALSHVRGSSLGLLRCWHKPLEPSADIRDLHSDYSAVPTGMVSGQALTPSTHPGNSLPQSNTISTTLVSREVPASSAGPDNSLSKISTIPASVVSTQALASSADPGHSLPQILVSTISTNTVSRQPLTSSAYPVNLLPQTSTVPADILPRPGLASLAYPGSSFSSPSTLPTIIVPSRDLENSSGPSTVPDIATSREALSHSAGAWKSSSSSRIPAVFVPVPRPRPLSAAPRDLSSQPSTSPVIMVPGQPLASSDDRRNWSFVASMMTGSTARSQTKKLQSTQQAESPRVLDLTDPGRSMEQLEVECGSVSKEAPTNKEPLYCPECNTADPYPNALSLRRHMTEMHKGLHGFRCDICGRGFKNIGSLRRHWKQIHTNQPVYRCDVCDRGFMYKDHFVGHMNKHNNTPTFKCTYCPQMFIYKPDMYHHRKQCDGRAASPSVRGRTPGRPKSFVASKKV